MDIYINLKQLSKKSRRVKAVLFHYENTPHTLGEFVKETVLIMLREFNERKKKTKEGIIPDPLSEEDIKNMTEIGKAAFGYVYNNNEITDEKAVETAYQSLCDGLVRVFINGEDVSSTDLNLRNVDINDIEASYRAVLNRKINLKDNDEVTFVKLTMLAGRLW